MEGTERLLGVDLSGLYTLKMKNIEADLPHKKLYTTQMLEYKLQKSREISRKFIRDLLMKQKERAEEDMRFRQFNMRQ